MQPLTKLALEALEDYDRLDVLDTLDQFPEHRVTWMETPDRICRWLDTLEHGNYLKAQGKRPERQYFKAAELGKLLQEIKYQRMHQCYFDETTGKYYLDTNMRNTLEPGDVALTYIAEDHGNFRPLIVKYPEETEPQYVYYQLKPLPNFPLQQQLHNYHNIQIVKPLKESE